MQHVYSREHHPDKAGQPVVADWAVVVRAISTRKGAARRLVFVPELVIARATEPGRFDGAWTVSVLGNLDAVTDDGAVARGIDHVKQLAGSDLFPFVVLFWGATIDNTFVYNGVTKEVELV